MCWGLTQQEIWQIKGGPAVERTATTKELLWSKLGQMDTLVWHVMCLHVGFPCVYVIVRVCSNLRFVCQMPKWVCLVMEGVV